MALALFAQVCGIGAIVFHEPEYYGDYDFYTKSMPPGWLRRLLSQEGRQAYDVLKFITCFCLTLSIAICVETYSAQPRAPLTDCLGALFLLIILLRYAHTRVFRTWHAHGRAAIFVAVLMVLLQLLVCVGAAAIAFILVSSASLAAWACIPMLLVLIAFGVNFAASCYVLHTVRISAYAYSAMGANSVSSTGSTPHDDIMELDRDQTSVKSTVLTY